MKTPALAVLSSFLLPAAILALNDTNALVREGLFPLAGGGASLEIVSETVTVTLKLEGRLATVRSYRIRNSGKAGMYPLGVLCSQWTDPCEGIRIDGLDIRFWNRTGRLSVKDGHVETARFPRAEIDACNETNDGDVCGHVWAELPIWLDAGATRTVTIRFGTELEESSFFEDALDRLTLYTEQFWKQNASARFELRFAIEGVRFTKDHFQQVPGSRYEMLPISGVDQGAVVWCLTDVDVSSEVSILHPWATDLCALYQLYHNAGGRYPVWPQDNPTTPCTRRQPI
jgi:hypothetical protein